MKCLHYKNTQTKTNRKELNRVRKHAWVQSYLKQRRWRRDALKKQTAVEVTTRLEKAKKKLQKTIKSIKSVCIFVNHVGFRSLMCSIENQEESRSSHDKLPCYSVAQ